MLKLTETISTFSGRSRQRVDGKYVVSTDGLNIDKLHKFHLAFLFFRDD